MFQQWRSGRGGPGSGACRKDEGYALAVVPASEGGDAERWPRRVIRVLTEGEVTEPDYLDLWRPPDLNLLESV